MCHSEAAAVAPSPACSPPTRDLSRTSASPAPPSAATLTRRRPSSASLPRSAPGRLPSSAARSRNRRGRRQSWGGGGSRGGRCRWGGRGCGSPRWRDLRAAPSPSPSLLWPSSSSPRAHAGGSGTLGRGKGGRRSKRRQRGRRWWARGRLLDGCSAVTGGGCRGWHRWMDGARPTARRTADDAMARGQWRGGHGRCERGDGEEERVGPTVG
ncbi:hypothetical protein DAI22_06g152700 [Oryza sativa Japonica Group]|nr:hypothetical protein DAI22_06g152700 [Oryza sativa Japonica Group]